MRILLLQLTLEVNPYILDDTLIVFSYVSYSLEDIRDIIQATLLHIHLLRDDVQIDSLMRSCLQNVKELSGQRGQGMVVSTKLLGHALLIVHEKAPVLKVTLNFLLMACLTPLRE